MASADLSRRVGAAVGYSPLCELSDLQRRQFHEALLVADTFEDLPGKWQAAIVKAEENRPKLRIVGGDQSWSLKPSVVLHVFGDQLADQTPSLPPVPGGGRVDGEAPGPATSG
jgi:hypothetical protein